MLSGDPLRYLVVPELVAAGWLFVAEREACLDSRRSDRRAQAPVDRRLP